MPVKPNGTDAKDIAFHFIDVTTGRATPHIIGKTINQAKSLLRSGYTKEEIIKVIDYIIAKGVNMYSLGYVNSAINNVLTELNKAEIAEIAKQEVKKLESSYAQKSEVSNNDESTERNRNKAERFSTQSRLGKKFDFDLFEK